MPYKDKKTQRAYQRRWMQKRRADWISEHGPCQRCGSWVQLEVDHVNHRTKFTHRIWSYTQHKRDRELAKCQVLCRACHLQKTIAHEVSFGEACHNAKLTDAAVRDIRTNHSRQQSYAYFAQKYGVYVKTVQKAALRVTWKRVI